MNRKFNIALIWNYISLAVMAVSGLLMNSIIAMVYGPEALGVFSETYAWYLIISQLSVWGIHMAIVKFVPEEATQEDKGSVLKTGLVLVILTSVAVAGFSELILVFIAKAAWKKSLQIALMGLILFSVNKVLVNYLNAIRRMVSYAVFSSLRYICFGVVVLLISLRRTDPDCLASVFPITETIVFVALSVYFLKCVNISGRFNGAKVREMLSFSTRIIPSYMVLELNTKVDIVCLGILVSSVSQIGIYSFAIFFTEGFYLLFITIRRIINPDIAEASVEGRLSEQLHKTSEYLRRYLIFGGGITYIGVSVGYLVICTLTGKPEYRTGIIYILIINLAILLNGRYIVFGDVLAQTGLPEEESALNVITVCCNFILNILLIFSFGTVGAAIATAISHFIFSYYMKIRVKKKTGTVL